MSEVRRIGMVIGTKPEKMEDYRKLHADEHPGVRDLLSKYNMRNFSIFIQRLPDGKEYLFGYYEYVGADYEKDMDALSREPRNAEWLKMCDPCQQPFPGESSWTQMESVYHND